MARASSRGIQQRGAPVRDDSRRRRRTKLGWHVMDPCGRAKDRKRTGIDTLKDGGVQHRTRWSMCAAGVRLVVERIRGSIPPGEATGMRQPRGLWTEFWRCNNCEVYGYRQRSSVEGRQ